MYHCTRGEVVMPYHQQTCFNFEIFLISVTTKIWSVLQGHKESDRRNIVTANHKPADLIKRVAFTAPGHKGLP